MKANSMTISIPNKGCDKNCSYCVSKITGTMKPNPGLVTRNIDKVLTLARLSQVSSVLLTGKGEPCLNIDEVIRFTRIFKEFPMEIQTNGIFLSKNPNYIKILSSEGMNVIAVSMDEVSCLKKERIQILSDLIHQAGMLLRVTFNVTNIDALTIENWTLNKFEDLFYGFKMGGVDQFTLRNIVNPNFTKETTESLWIKKNVDPLLYTRLSAELKKMCQTSGHHLRKLPYGAEVYDLHGVAVSFSDYCVQDDNNTEDIRSLIFQENGHVYTSWNSEASKIF